MQRHIAAFVLSLLFINTAQVWAATEEERAQAAADTRQGLLKVVVSYFGPIVGMARDQIPYDAAVVKANAEKIATLLPMIPHVFNANTTSFDIDTEAKDEIWDNTEDFAAKANTSAERALALAAAADVDKGAAMKAFGALGGSCKGCHDNYREQD